MTATKVAVLIGARKRADLLERSLWYLTRQTHRCTTWVVDDGSETDAVEQVCAKFKSGVKYFRLRKPGEKLRGQNMAWWYGYEHSKANYIICSHPEILVPLTAVEQMLDEHIPKRRSVPMLYCLGPDHQAIIDKLPWKWDIHCLKALPGFWEYMSHWSVRNKDTDKWRHHFGFCGMYRKEWDFYNQPDGFLPKRDEIYFDDAWMIHKETEAGRLPNYLKSIEVYHQYHEWCRPDGKPPEAWTKQFNDANVPSTGKTPDIEQSARMLKIMDTLNPDGTQKNELSSRVFRHTEHRDLK